MVDKNTYALYFSRAPIPWNRENFHLTTKKLSTQPYLRHIGIYAYTAGFLKAYCQWESSPLEEVESLEQLRILWHGEKILVKIVEKAPEAGVDTAEDLARVQSIFEKS